MASTIIKINSAASGAADTNSGCGPGDGVTAGTPVSIAVASVFAGILNIGLYGNPDLSNVVIGHTIQINNTTAGTSALFAISYVYGTEYSGEVTVDADGVTCTVTSGAYNATANYPVKVGDDYRYITSGGEGYFIINSAVTPGTGIAFVQPKAVNVTGANFPTGQFSAVIGGVKRSLFDTLTIKIIDGGATGVYDGRDGWIVDCLSDETVNWVTQVSWRLIATNTSAGRRILFRGQSATDPTVWTFTRTSGSASGPFAATTDQNGVLFHDFVWKTNTAGVAFIAGNNSRADLKNCQLVSGTQNWTNFQYRMYGNYTDCRFENTSFPFSYGRFENCDFVAKANTSFAGGTPTFIRCRVKGYSTDQPCTLPLTDISVLSNCDFIDTLISIRNANAGKKISNCSFDFSDEYIGYAITWTTTTFGQWSYAGGAAVNNNYYNCTGLVDPALDPDSAVFSGTTNVDPAYTDPANGDWTSTALNALGTGSTFPYTSVAMQHPIGSYIALAGTGGAGTVFIDESDTMFTIHKDTGATAQRNFPFSLWTTAGAAVTGKAHTDFTVKYRDSTGATGTIDRVAGTLGSYVDSGIVEDTGLSAGTYQFSVPAARLAVTGVTWIEFSFAVTGAITKCVKVEVAGNAGSPAANNAAGDLVAKVGSFEDDVHANGFYIINGGFYGDTRPAITLQADGNVPAIYMTTSATTQKPIQIESSVATFADPVALTGITDFIAGFATLKSDATAAKTAAQRLSEIRATYIDKLVNLPADPASKADVTSVTVTVAPLQASVVTPTYTVNGGTVYPLRFAQNSTSTVAFAITDGTGAAVSLVGKTVSMVIHNQSASVWKITSPVISTNTATFTVGTPYTDNKTEGQYGYKIWNETDNILLATGAFSVLYAPNGSDIPN